MSISATVRSHSLFTGGLEWASYDTAQSMLLQRRYVETGKQRSEQWRIQQEVKDEPADGRNV